MHSQKLSTQEPRELGHCFHPSGSNCVSGHSGVCCAILVVFPLEGNFCCSSSGTILETWHPVLFLVSTAHVAIDFDGIRGVVRTDSEHILEVDPREAGARTYLEIEGKGPS